MLLYELKTLQDDTARQGAMRKSVDSLQARLMQSQSMNNAVHFYKPGWYRWRLRNHYRLIARLQTIVIDGDAQDILFMGGLIVKSRLKGFNNNQLDQYASQIAAQIDVVVDQLRNHLDAGGDPQIDAIAKVLHGDGDDHQLPEPLPEAWNAYLYPDWISTQKECPVFETLEWRTVVRDLNQDSLRELNHNLLQVTDSPDKNPIAAARVRQLAIDSGWLVHYVVCATDDHQALPWQWFVFLLDLTPVAGDDNSARAAGLWEKIKQDLIADGTRDALAAMSKTAYPALLLYDDELWRRMEVAHSPELALSAEEVGLLGKFRQLNHLPTLLEGRAGSGKSTMLFYFLSEAITSWAGNQLDTQKILIITQSDKLLAEAKKNVHALSNACMHIFGRHHAANVQVRGDRCAFVTLYQLLAQMLGGRQSAHRFRERSVTGAYVNIARFRRLFNGRQGNLTHDDGDVAHIFRGHVGNLSAEMAWFVIRSYIKGHAVIDPEDNTVLYMDPEAYDELPSGDRHVDSSVFNMVYKKVWLPWYQPLTANSSSSAPLWDDQDLTLACMLALSRQCLDEGQRYGLIVCDEGQDFTPIETEVLTYFMVYRYYDMRPHHHSRAPLLVAADPFQTINPSGFRWEGVKDILTHSLQGSNTTFGTLTVHHAALAFNYRNDWHIARLANTVQAARRYLIRRRTEPQQIWRQRQNDFPVGQVRIDLNDPQRFDEIRAKILNADVDVIVPYHDNAVIDALALPQDAQEFLVTPLEIKGLERKNVIVAGFGDFFFRNFGGRGDFQGPWRLPDQAVPFEMEYFFNNLYVAVTRAREELVLVDSIQGFEAFWDRLPEAMQRWIDQDPGDFDWRENCDYHADDYDLDSLRGGDPVEQARDWRDRGRANQDAKEMERAGYWFSRAIRRHEDGELMQHDRDSLIRDNYECRAWAHFFKGQLKPAAEMMRDKACDPQQAVHWFWQGLLWTDLQSSIATHAARLPQYWQDRAALCELPLTVARDDQFSAPDINKYLALLNTECADRQMDSGFGASHRPWQHLIDVFLIAAANHCRVLELDDMLAVLRFGRRMAHVYDVPYQALAEIAYAANATDDAIRYFEYAGKTEEPRYHKLVALKKPYPDNLRHWESALQLNEVLAQFQRHVGAQPVYQAWLNLQSDDRRRVARAMAQATDQNSHPPSDLLVYSLLLADGAGAARQLDRMLAAGDLTLANIAEIVARVLRMTSQDPTPISEQVQPERRVVDCFWPLVETVFSPKTDIAAPEQQSAVFNLLLFVPSIPRLMENFRGRRDQLGLARNMMPLWLAHAEQVDGSELSKAQREGIARTLLKLLWQIEDNPAPSGQRHRASGKRQAVMDFFYRDWPQKLRVKMALDGLGAVCHWLEGLNVDRYEVTTREMVQAVAERFTQLHALRQLPDPDWESSVILEAVKRNWRLVGRFMKVSPYRLHGIRYFEDLRETLHLTGKAKAELDASLENAQERKQDRDRRGRDERMAPGQYVEDENISFRFMGNGRIFQIEDLVDGRRCRFILDRQSFEPDPDVSHVSEAGDDDQRKGRIVFEFDHGSVEIEYEWRQAIGELRIQLPSRKWIGVERVSH